VRLLFIPSLLCIICLTPMSIASSDWVLEENLRLLKIRCSEHLIPSLKVEIKTNHCPIKWVKRGL